MRRRLAFVSAACIVFAAAYTGRAPAYVPEKTPHRDAAAAAVRVVHIPAARPTLAGLVVMRGGRIVYGLRADRALAPASLLKLTTTTTALMRWGPEHRFATRVAVAASSGGTTSTLYMIGGGDPTLSTAADRAHRFLPRPTDVIKRPACASGSPTVEELAGNVRAAGITRVTGDLIADDTMFDALRVKSGWLPR